MNYDSISKLAHSYWLPKVFFSALKVGIFDYLSGTPKSAEDVAVNLNVNYKGAEIVLNTLSALNIITKDDNEKYSVSEEITDHFSKNSPNYKGDIFLYFDSRMADFIDFDELLRFEDPLNFKKSKPIPMSKEMISAFIIGMENVTRDLVPFVIDNLPLEGKKKIIDLGAAAGNYTLAIAKKCPDAEVIYYDLDEVVPIAKEFIKEKRSNIFYESGDFLTDTIGSDYDFAWVSQIIHRTGDKNTKHLLEKIYDSLSEGGVVAIHDHFLDISKTFPEQAVILNVFWFVTTGGNGKAFSRKETEGLLTDIGFKIKEYVTTPISSGIIIAQK